MSVHHPAHDPERLALLELWHDAFDQALEDSTTDEAALKADRAVAAEAVAQALARLEPEERRVVELLHGLSGEEPRSVHDLSHKLGIGAKRLQELNATATAKLAADFFRLTGGNPFSDLSPLRR